MDSEEIIISKALTATDLEGILALQSLNHANNLTPDQKTSNGYVTLEHTMGQLQTMVASSAQVIAKADDRVVGYALSLLQVHRSMYPILNAMFDRVDSIRVSAKIGSYYVMGQVCIDSNYRGRGVFNRLYDEHKRLFSSSYNSCVTEVSIHNIPSVKAHAKVGFRSVMTFEDEQDDWSVIAWDWS